MLIAFRFHNMFCWLKGGFSIAPIAAEPGKTVNNDRFY